MTKGRTYQRVVMGKRLRDARDKAGITQQEAGRRTGLARATIAAKEMGLQSVSAEQVLLLASAYGCSVSSLFGQDLVSWPITELKRIMVHADAMKSQVDMLHAQLAAQITQASLVDKTDSDRVSLGFDEF